MVAAYGEPGDPIDLMKSPAWQSCKPAIFTFDALIAALPCVAKTDPAAVNAFFAFTASPNGDALRQQLAQKLANGDSERAFALYATWSTELMTAQRQVADALQKPLLTTIFPYKTSPVLLNSCVEKHAASDPHWNISASWTPTVTLSTVKIRIETQDASGVTLQTDDLAPTGTFPGNTESSDAWTIGDAHMPPQANVARIRCAVIGAIAVDGRTWAAPVPNATASP
jgi:hypothetical protein